MLKTLGFTVFNDKAADENNHQLFQDFPYIDPPQLKPMRKKEQNRVMMSLPRLVFIV